MTHKEYKTSRRNMCRDSIHQKFVDFIINPRIMRGETEKRKWQSIYNLLYALKNCGKEHDEMWHSYKWRKRQGFKLNPYKGY